MDIETIGIRLTDKATGQPEFLCPRDGWPLWEEKSMAYFICNKPECGFQLGFRQVQHIAQWLRGYA